MCHWNFGSSAVLGPSGGRMGIAEEAKTRGFPPPSFGGFGFVVCVRVYTQSLADWDGVTERPILVLCGPLLIPVLCLWGAN